jgi:hypothetical protein
MYLDNEENGDFMDLFKEVSGSTRDAIVEFLYEKDFDAGCAA